MSTQERVPPTLEASSRNSRDRDLVAPAKLAMILGFLSFVAFVPTLGNDFVAWDDPDNFLDNIGFRGIGWRNLYWAWTSMIVGVYQPVAWMILEVQYLFTGLNPYGYHLASALMHTLNAVALYYLTLALVGRCRPDLMREQPRRVWLCSAVSVAFFALHPMRTEVVAWASAQPYLPCAFFSILSVLSYLRANPPGATEVKSRWLLVSFLLYAAAVLSKAAAIPLPAVFLVLDVYPLCRLGSERGWWTRQTARVLTEKVPFFALCSVFMAAAVLARVYDRNLDPIGNTGISGRITLSCFSVMFYPVKSLWPLDMHAFYMRPRWEKLFDPRFLIAVAGTIAATTVIVRQRKAHPGLMASWVAYLLMLAPVSGVITTGMQVAADRYGYLTMMAFTAPLAVGGCGLVGWLARFRLAVQMQSAAAGLMILTLLFLTFNQCRTWKDSEALWSNGIEHGAGHVADLHNNLGAVWASKGHFDLAIFAFSEAIRLKPSLQAAKDNLNKAIAHRARDNDNKTKPKPKKQA